MDLDDILVKICLGQATDEEEEEWRKKLDLPKDIAEQIKESCALGEQIAKELDGSSKDDELRPMLEGIMEEIEVLKNKVDLIFKKMNCEII